MESTTTAAAQEHGRMIGAMVRDFADAEIRPRATDLDESESFPDDLYRRMAELGLFGITVPEEMGGVGADCATYALVMEELARGYASVADQCGLIELVSSLLATFGTSGQRAAYLGPMLAFEKRVAYALTEAGAGSDIAAVRTTARPTEDGWVLSGEKIWIHNAPVADVAVVLARTDPDAGKRGLSIFLVDTDRPGVTVGPKEHKLGQRASQVGALSFDSVALPADALLGERNRGFHMMMGVLDKGRIGIAALAVGIVQAALERATEYARERHQFDQPIADFQGVSFMLADMAKAAQAGRLLVRDAAASMDRGERATKACSMAKCFAGDAAVEQTSNAIQIHGGIGYIRGIEVERLYRDAKITQIYEGTNQIQRLVISRLLLAEA